MTTDSRSERNSRGGSERTGDRNSRKADLSEIDKKRKLRRRIEAGRRAMLCSDVPSKT